MKTNTLSLKKAGGVALAAALAATALTGCYTPEGRPDNTATGALVGAASGAGIGAAAAGRHDAGAGALIGAGAGALFGALLGHSADEAQEARLRQQYPDTYARAVQGVPLSVADIKSMNKAGLKDETIIAQISNSHTVFHLDARQIIDLHDSGVSQTVIDFMINTPSMAPAPSPAVAVSDAPPPPTVEPIPAVPGPGYVWVNGEWLWNGGWYWSAGYWALPPYPGAIWVGGYWGRGPRGWVRYGGHWRR